MNRARTSIHSRPWCEIWVPENPQKNPTVLFIRNKTLKLCQMSKLTDQVRDYMIKVFQPHDFFLTGPSMLHPHMHYFVATAERLDKKLLLDVSQGSSKGAV